QESSVASLWSRRKTEWGSSDQGSDGAHANLEARERRKAMGRKAARVNRERADQRASGPQPHQGTSCDQTLRTCSGRKRDAPKDGDGCSNSEADPWAETVKRHAQRN